MNILAGVFAPDEGSILLDGREIRFDGPWSAHARGIATIFQELSLVPHLSVAENIFLGREPRRRSGLLDGRRLAADTRELLRRVELDVDPATPVAALRVGQQQIVEIARAVSTDARVLILDEPTSSLSGHEVEVLFGLIRELKARGVALVYITHKLEELERVADEVTVLRDGRVAGAAPLSALTRDRIVRLMVGRETAILHEKAPARLGAELLRTEGLSLRMDRGAGALPVSGVDLHLRAGEVLGIFGLVGAGRTELLETLFGLHAGRMTGKVFLAGEPVAFASPIDAIAHGLALAPEDRKREGLVLDLSVTANASLASLEESLAHGFIDFRREAAQVAPYLERFRVKAASPGQPIRLLSGGNQQKVILAKWLASRPRVLLLDEPTRGIDIGAKREIYAFIDELAQAGLGLIVVSSELPEVLALSDRVMVMCEGRKTAEFDRAAATPEAVLRAALPAAAPAPSP
jgi:ribose transport system ATP-binding protein